MKCRHCATDLHHTFLDLCFAPPSNAYLNKEDLKKSEKYFPLKIKVCETCWLVQTEDYAQAEDLFSADYAYFSSTSATWLTHAMEYADSMVEIFGLSNNSLVIEVASNDGYLLKNFVEKGIPCLGIEPTASTAEAAECLGIPVVREFFGEGLARKLASTGHQADLIAGNNVFAHVPDINDFTRGLKIALKPGGTITLEFPQLLKLIENIQFDTVYHEHFSYLSLIAVCEIFRSSGLRVFDVEQLSTHGGSLRVYGVHEDDPRPTRAAVQNQLDLEIQSGLKKLETYLNFQVCADNIKDSLLRFLLDQKRLGLSVGAYGAAAKGNTVLNYAGVKPDLLPFVCDAAPSKQHKFMPGSHIPILSPMILQETKLDYLLILPWNIAAEVKEQLSYLRRNGTRFVTIVPALLID
jgi:SAM-dependent methyltransferase